MDRIAITAKMLGWSITDTGGGCRAYLFMDDAANRHYLLTDDSGTHLPTWGDALCWGTYTNVGEIGQDDGHTWTSTFGRDVDAEGTDGYTTEIGDMAIVDPLQGTGVSWGLSADPVECYSMPRPIAQFLSCLYNAAKAGDAPDVDDLMARDTFVPRPELEKIESDDGADSEAELKMLVRELVEAIRASAPSSDTGRNSDEHLHWMRGWNANGDRLWAACAELRAIVGLGDEQGRA